MEALLSLAFDNIASNEPTKLRKGLRQIESLLAQICLPPPSSRRNPSLSPTSPSASPKTLRDLPTDPAYLTFFALQESFEYNIVSRLLPTLEKLLGHHSTPTTDALVTSTLALLQGLLLLHPPSRHLLSSPTAMTLLLDLLDAPATQSAALQALVAALLGCPKNTRAFEKADGLGTVTGLFKRKGSGEVAKRQALEFLYFYLLPEDASDASVFGGAGPRHGGGGSGKSNKSTGSGKSGGSSGSEGSAVRLGETRTAREKQKLLGRYLSNVDDLVQDLRESAPFGFAPVVPA